VASILPPNFGSMGLMTVKTNTRLMFFIIWNTLTENDIKIPYPHRVVEFKNMPDIPEE
jgi:small-conductance mechanosensitive channel